jgi:hypothetical protein
VKRSNAFCAAVGLLVSLSGCGLLPGRRMILAETEALEAAEKPDPQDSPFGGCGPAGSQPDYVLNRLKNRVDEGKYLRVPLPVIAQLGWPRRVGYRFRNQWTEDETRSVKRFEGVAIEVEGYLVGYRLEIPEPPNCYSTAARERDYHMWLAEEPRGRERHSVVVEVTPRVRAAHPAWNDEALAALVGTRVRVRVRGWLMLDQMHPESVKLNRATLWEVHPITQLAWKRADGDWVSLDSLSPAAQRESGARTR